MKAELLTILFASIAGVLLGVPTLVYLGTPAILALKLAIPVSIFVGLMYALEIVIRYRRYKR